MKIITAQEQYKRAMKDVWKFRKGDPHWIGHNDFKKLWSEMSDEYLSRRVAFINSFKDPLFRQRYIDWLRDPLVAIRIGKRMTIYPLYRFAWVTVLSRYPDIRLKVAQMGIQNYCNIAI